MKLTNKNITLLAVVAAVLLTLAIVSSGSREHFRGNRIGAPLIQGIDTTTIDSVTIQKGEQEVAIVRGQKSYLAASLHNYPVDASKLNTLLISLLELRADEAISSRNYAEYDLTPETATTVTIACGNEKMGVMIGKNAPRGGGVYLRLLGGDEVFVSRTTVAAATETTHYLDRSLLSIAKDTIGSIELSGSESYKIVRDGSALKLAAVTAGHEAKQETIDALAAAFANLTFEGARPATGVAPNGSRMTVESSEQLSYEIIFGELDGTTYLRFGCNGPGADEVRRVEEESNRIVNEARQTGKTASAEELAKNDAIAKAIETAREFNERHRNWVYTLPSWKMSHFTKKKADFMKAIEVAADKKDNAGQGEDK